jgi:hypothetical protein
MVDDYDRDWRLASRVVLADFRGLLAFRQFKLTTDGDVYRAYQPMEYHAKFDDDFTMRSIFQRENWRPTGNRAHCNVSDDPDHPVPSRDCGCGYYGSYSSSIIYHPDDLRNPLYCFAAVRMYGKDLPLAQNGLRSSGADVVGVLFHPAGRKLKQVNSLMLRLDKEGIFHTFSAKAFLRQFPDQSYTDLLGFDPIARLAGLHHICSEMRPERSPDHWQTIKYSHKLYRPIRSGMLLRRDLPGDDRDKITMYEVYLKPEYCPGGRLYRHPLLEVWDE